MRVFDWLSRRRRNDDLDDELRAHLTMAERDLREDGLDPHSARLTARRTFGNVMLTREATRRAWGGTWRDAVRDLGHDVRYAVRVLGRSPGYALAVIGVLALGIGANVSVFSLFRSLTLMPIAGVEGSGQLGVLVARTSAGRILPLSYPDYTDLAAAHAGAAAVTGTSMELSTLDIGERGERVWTELVTGNYFEVLGVHAQIGRTLLPSDAVRSGEPAVAVISDGLWRRAFGADPDIVGRAVRLGKQPVTIVGVAERAFHGTIVSIDIEVFAPVGLKEIIDGPQALTSRDTPALWGLVRLRPGVGIAAAAEEAGTLSARLASLHTRRDNDQRATVLPMWESPFGAQTYMLPAVLLVGVMGVLLLVLVCANISNLALVRGLSRRGEIAARLALGASRARIIRLLLIESAVLTVPGAIVGLLASRVLLPLITGGTFATAVGRMYLNVSMDGGTVVFAVTLASAGAAVFGLLPALRTSRVDLAATMKQELSPRSGSRERARNLLVVAQVAVSLVLLVGAGLVVRSLAAARTADPGFDAADVLSISADVEGRGLTKPQADAFHASLVDTLAAEADVEAVSLAAETPLRLVPGRSRDVVIEGYVPRPLEDMQLSFNAVAPGYFDLLRIPRLAGRDFTASDAATSHRVAIVNDTMARRHWGSPEAALGKRLRLGGTDWAVIVGVASDIKYAQINEPPKPYLYVPATQYALTNLIAHVRVRQLTPALTERLRAVVQGMDAGLTVNTQSLQDQIGLALTVYTMAAIVLAIFGAMAGLLAAVGTYGLVSYTARQAAHETGIRMAIGATRADVVRQFVNRGLALGAAGAGIGILLSLVVARALAGILYGVTASDPAAFTAAVAFVIAAVALASLLPAWQASRANPVAALRYR